MDFAQSDLVKNALRHSQAEAGMDMAGTMATLEDDPVYDLMPIGLRMRGYDRARRYYEHYFANVGPRIAHFSLVAEWIGKDGINQEYDVVFRHDDGREKTYRILGILTFGTTKMSGERIYAEEELLKIMFAPIWDELEPIYP